MTYAETDFSVNKQMRITVVEIDVLRSTVLCDPLNSMHNAVKHTHKVNKRIRVAFLHWPTVTCSH